jgi:NAD(P)-dependent dehydrogenase (short-subunit alcohol dehydrogenase family)
MNVAEFENRVAVVTGAGAGLGREYAVELARRGCRVVVNDLGGSGSGVGSSTDAADTVVNMIVAAGGTAIANHDSVATRSGGCAIIDAALDTFGRLDVLISNAGILRTGRFDELTDDDIDAVIDVHLKAGFYVGQPAFAAMKRRRYGRILFTASSSGVFGHPWQASYAAAKAGLVGLSNVVSIEGKDHGVLSNVLMPNARTRLAEEIDWSWQREFSDLSATFVRLMTTSASPSPPSQQRLDPSWVAPLAIFLVSERSTVTQGVFSAVSGRYARVFAGVTEGWTAPELASDNEIAGHWNEICSCANFYEPKNVYDEALYVRDKLNELRSGSIVAP